ncbi:MAG TPA: flagellar assembly protein FliX [Rhodospirillaceae bacterium]|nr:flagellar assembly protein FliX [Candidatus Neomarinimicrobiota bacterium]HCX15234.1 flagellar assembly protein FliX [Rhodospirillaceae bacterium]
MKVEGPKSGSPVQKTKPSSKAGKSKKTGDFAAELDRVSGSDGTQSATGPESVNTVAGVGGILAAQSVSDDEGLGDYKERQRRARRGAEILDRLEEIRRGLLIGAVPKERLGELARMVREKRERGADPVISRLLDEIELRAEVELAKLSRRFA